MRAVKGLSMEKWLCWASMGISGLLLLLFILDLVAGFPFGISRVDGIGMVIDIFGVIACGIVLYLGWDAAKDL
jgi:hypothetical protein